MKKFLLGVLLIVFMTGCMQSGKPYPHDYCLVTGNDLGSMGDPVSYVHEGQMVKFCCKPCIKKFKKDPVKFMSRLNGPRPKKEKH